MKKILFSIALTIIISALDAQTPSTSSTGTVMLDCEEVCFRDVTVQEGTLLGVEVNNYHLNRGAFVLDVLDNTSAEKYSFKRMDVILQVNDTLITGMEHLVKTIQSYKPSNLVTINYLRGDETFDVDVVLGAKVTRVVNRQYCCEDNSQYLNSSNISISPNPAISSINVKLDEAEKGKYVFQVFDINGKRVITKVNDHHSGYTEQIDISHIPSGEYFIRISEGKHSFTKPFIKQK